VPEGWLKVGRREYEHEDRDVEIEILPARNQDSGFRVRFEYDGEWTTVQNVQPTEKAALDLGKDVAAAFTEAYGTGTSVEAAIEQATVHGEP
jgi:hypothetical protein